MSLMRQLPGELVFHAWKNDVEVSLEEVPANVPA